MIHIDTINPGKASIVSITSATGGSIMNITQFDLTLQRLAYILAIVSALVAIYNGTRSWYQNKKKKNETAS